MTPLRLHLTNFLSYGDTCDPIDFDGVHVACLCGQNGHGKSALLDSITWSLWGQARTNTADDLVRQGQTHMQVEFEFLLDGQRYRVIRKRSRGKASQSDLQLQAREAEEGSWRALTGQGVRDTQGRINTLLRMDYETFINSAFILQGRADEFARKSPGDRKKILGEILGLGVYDQLSDSARARRSEAAVRGKSLEAEINRMEAERAREPELRTQAEQQAVEHERALLAVERARVAVQAVLVEKARFDDVRKRRDDLARRLAAAEGELEVQKRLLTGAEKKVAQARTLTARAGEIRERAQELEVLRKEQEALTVRLEEVRVLEGERNRLDRQIQEARAVLDTRLQLGKQRVRELNARADQLPRFRQDMVDLERQAAALDRLAEERATFGNRLQELAGLRAAAQAEQRRCADELEKADERFKLLKGARAQCPLCEAELPEEKRFELGHHLRRDKEALKLSQGTAIQQEADARQEESEIQRRLKDLDNKIATGRMMRDRLAQARQKCLELEEAERELPAELELVRSVETQLQEAQFALELRVALAEVDTRIRKTSYDDQHRRRVLTRISALSQAERELQSLETAEAELPEAERQVETLLDGIRTREAAMADDRAARTAVEQELARAGAVEAEVLRQQAVLADAERREGELSRQLGALRQALERCAEVARLLTDRKRELAEAAKDEAAYEELVRAFGRNGIQALIIENALPEIETEANTLLGRMSDGQLAIRLKTQRELRSGAQAETLEIEISDGMGPRRYELFSGGEAFRVNFALRIALSKLLARRAGARLETLVIDEGFGSQDNEGRQRLVEAIQTVQDDFARILVITHLDELKDAFPTRIEVSKGPSGSQVSVY